MKKNLISVLILALLVVNLVLTFVMMFSTMGSVKKTSALVTNIATVLNIELDGEKTEDEAPSEDAITIADIETFDIPEKLTIPLKKGADGKEHFYIVNVSIMMNTKHADYETYKEKVASNASVLQSLVIETIQNHTLEEIQTDPESIRQEILVKIQEAFNSTFIYKIAFSNVLYQ